jgi:hypothetical protein
LNVDANREIRRYLDEHGGTYTTEALRKGLLAAGHDPAAVEVAIGEWAAARLSAGMAQDDQRRFGRWAFGLHLGALVAMVVILVALKGGSALGIGLGGAGILAIPLLIAWWISSTVGGQLLRRTGLLVALILPALSALALGGTCLAVLNAQVPAPARNGSVHLQISPPLAFDGSGPAGCYVAQGGGGVQVNSQGLGTLGGKTVIVGIYWSRETAETPKGTSPTFVSITLNPVSATQPSEGFVATAQSRFEVDATADGLAGTVRFFDLVNELDPLASAEITRDTLSGSVTWSCS